MIKINKLCIIEDDPTHLFVIKKRIELTGIVETILSYKNGKEAFENLHHLYLSEEKLPEIIFLDLNMPIWDGWQFLDEFLKLKPKTEVKIYILTSSNEKTDKTNAAKYNLKNNYLTKPISSERIKEILGAV